MTKMIISAVVAVIVMAAGTMSAQAEVSFADGNSIRTTSDESLTGSRGERQQLRRANRETAGTTRRASRSSARTNRSARAATSRVASVDRPQRGPSLNSRIQDGGEGRSVGSGIASYYWQPQRVASGGWFNPNAMTAAHKTLPFGTRVRVTNLNNGRSAVVTINDRGPYVRGRVIDLSRAAAGVIGMQGAGLARVKMDIVSR